MTTSTPKTKPAISFNLMLAACGIQGVKDKMSKLVENLKWELYHMRQKIKGIDYLVITEEHSRKEHEISKWDNPLPDEEKIKILTTMGNEFLLTEECARLNPHLKKEIAALRNRAQAK